jgi:hypothetical protein
VAVAAMLVLAGAVEGTTATSSPSTEVVTEIRRHTERYQDVARAREDGYLQAGGMLARHGIHFVNLRLQLLAVTVGLDLSRPPALLYVERDGDWRLAGIEYVLAQAPSGPGPIPAEAWERHEASCHYRDDEELAAASSSSCPSKHPSTGSPFVIWHPTLAVAHVWAFIPNPAGPFAPENAALAPWGGSAHRHSRSAAEAAYSTLNHRVSGAMLLTVALLTWWQTRRARRFPWSVLSAPVWMAFSVYLFFSGDPEAWPLGPGSLPEALADGVVLQHKLLTVIPMLIGIIEVLRGAGWLRSPRWLVAFPALALLGGGALFIHTHDGGFHLDQRFLHHAIMGATALAGGVALLVARGTRAGRAVLTVAWPILLTVVSLLLLVYSET